jgi:hypothetical protein
LHLTLRLWRLRAAAYSGPGSEARLGEARSGAGGGRRSRTWSLTGPRGSRLRGAGVPEGELPGQVRGQGVSSAQRAGVGCL